MSKDRPPRRSTSHALARRALALWPRLDREALRRCRDDPRRIASLVARRTPLSIETIVSMLVAAQLTADEPRELPLA
ncbi:MAG: hypothetical protein U0869_09040 [Chloroflexota bacterium]